jgi:hypothetical protein
VVAGTFCIGHTLEHLLQHHPAAGSSQQRAPAWTADRQHLAAARAATNFLRFQQLLLWRPALVDALELLEAEASASQQEQAELQRVVDTNRPDTSLLGSPTADAAFLALLRKNGCLAAKPEEQLLAQDSTRKLVKALQRGRDQGNAPGCNMQGTSLKWSREYGDWLHGVVETAMRGAAKQFVTAAQQQQQQQQQRHRMHCPPGGPAARDCNPRGF